jgi:hypothetical protein
MIEPRDCWVCELPGCGHAWIKTGDIPPDQCSRCRKRGWNKRGEAMSPAIQPASDGQLSPPLPAVQLLTDAVATSAGRVTIGRTIVTRLPMPSRPARKAPAEQVCASCGSIGGLHQRWCTKGAK